MMAGRGGYQKPGSPAPVSGMGAQSQRTDGGPADKQRMQYIANLPYGEGQEFMDIQGGAPMEAAAPTPSASSAKSAPAQLGREMPQVVPLNAPSQRPHENIMTGVGDINIPAQAGVDQQQNDMARAQLASYRPVLMYMASRPDTSADTRDFIRQLMEY